MQVSSFEVRIWDNHEVDIVITATNICMTKFKICAARASASQNLILKSIWEKDVYMADRRMIAEITGSVVEQPPGQYSKDSGWLTVRLWKPPLWMCNAIQQGCYGKKTHTHTHKLGYLHQQLASIKSKHSEERGCNWTVCKLPLGLWQISSGQKRHRVHAL